MIFFSKGLKFLQIMHVFNGENKPKTLSKVFSIPKYTKFLSKDDFFMPVYDNDSQNII